MLIIPFDRKFDWSNPPVITLVLMLINILCYVFWQSGDDQHEYEAMSYYADSGLAELELTKFYKAQNRLTDLRSLREELGSRYPMIVFYYDDMLENTAFMHRLKAGLIIKSDDVDYTEWKIKRQRFEELLSNVVVIEYGLKTADPDGASLIAHMFLHGSVMHLLGNMVFLLIIGLLVEVMMGPWVYLLSYLLTGLGSAGFDFIFLPNHFAPSIGASGAVAGLMGMYTALYWTRKIRFFYFLVIYFDYIKLPAIFLLPLWIGNEIFQVITYPDSNINYFAHLGGLVTGAFVGLLIRHFIPSFDDQFLKDEDQVFEYEQQLQLAQNLCHQFEYRQAMSILQRLNSRNPDDIMVLSLLQRAARIEPEGRTYHQISRNILMRYSFAPYTDQLKHEVFYDYLKYAQPGPILDEHSICELLDWFIGKNALKEAELLTKKLITKKGFCGNQYELLHRLADLADDKGFTEKSVFYRQVAKRLQ